MVVDPSLPGAGVWAETEQATAMATAASGHVCLAPGVDPVRASFELIFGHPAATSAIIGTINPQHLAQNVATAAAVIQDIA